MNSSIFNACSRFRQREMVSQKGIILTSYQNGGFTYLLYQVAQFYVEETRDTASGFRLGYCASEDAAMLEHYLPSIDISGISTINA